MLHVFRSFVLAICLLPGFLQVKPANAQELPEKLNSFLQKHAAEKLNLVTNKQIYQAGDTAFFRVSSWQNASDALIEVQLLGNDSSKKSTFKILLKNGAEVSYIIIPASLVSGDYLLRAFNSRGWEASALIHVLNPALENNSYNTSNWAKQSVASGLKLNKLASTWEIDWNLPNKPVEPKGWLLITGPNQVYYSQQINFSGLSGKITIPANAIPAKNATLILAENSGAILDNYIYTPLGTDNQLQLSLNKTVFNRREPVELNIVAGTAVSKAGNFLMNVRVMEQSDTVSENLNTSFSFKRTLPELDLKIIASASSSMAEDYIFTLNGVLLSAIDKKPASNSLIHLLVPATNQTEVLYSDKQGRIKIELDPFEQTKPILFRAIQDNIEFKNLIFVPDSSQKIPNWPLAFNAEALTSNHRKWLTKYRMLNQINQAYYGNLNSEDNTSNNYWKPSLWQENKLKPTTSYDLLKFEKFGNVTEIFRELIPAVEVVKRKDGIHARLYARLVKKFYNYYPLFLIDGIPTYDVETILNIPAEQLVKIDVFNTSTALAPFDVLSTGGVIALYTKNRNFSPTLLHDNIIQVTGTVPGVEIKTEFKSAPTLPNFKPTVYWNPLLKPDANGNTTISFTTSDQIGRFVVEVTFATPQGDVITTQTNYAVEIQ